MYGCFLDQRSSHSYFTSSTRGKYFWNQKNNNRYGRTNFKKLWWRKAWNAKVC